MKITRRDFIKTGGAGVLGSMVLSGGFMAFLSSRKVIAGEGQEVQNAVASRYPWRFVVDIRKCIGCGRCVQACKRENNVPLDPEYNRTWVERYVISDTEEVYVDSPDAGIAGFNADYVNAKYANINIRKSFFVPKLCNHCQSPPCVQVCPVAATYATDEGVVLVDRKACIGCRYCVQACPYMARFLDPRLKVVDKCTWCYHRVTKGLLPACVEVCPAGARNFGDITDPQSRVSQLIRGEALAVLKPDLGTEPMVYYIGLEMGVR